MYQQVYSNKKRLYLLPRIYAFYYGSQNKHRLFSYMALTDHFFYTAVDMVCVCNAIRMHEWNL